MSTNVSLIGNYSYVISPGANTVTLTTNEIENSSATYTTGTLQLELWLTLTPWNNAAGATNTGWEVATDRITGSSNGTLGPNQYFSNISDTVTYSNHPPAGTYYVTLAVAEYTGKTGTDGGFTTDTAATFSNYLLVGSNGSLSQGGTIATASPPTLSVQNGTVEIGANLAASGLITSTSDPGGNPITRYEFYDNGGGAGYFTVGGVKQAAGTWFQVAASSLSTVQFVGTSAGTESVSIADGDAYNWSAYQTTSITTQSSNLPTISVQNQSVSGSNFIQASALIANVTAPAGTTITYYDFRDDGGGGGYFTLNGVKQATGGWITVSASQVSNLLYVGSNTAATEKVDVAAWDGTDWSNYQTATITTTAAALPVITVQNQTVAAGGTLAASKLIVSATDPAGHAITQYDFRDDGGGGGTLSLNGVQQTQGAWIAVSASALSSLQFNAAGQPGSETIDVAAWNGSVWSYYQTATVTTTGVSRPVISVQNATLSAGQSIQASSLIAAASDPSGNAITYYDFRDDGGGGGYFTLNGVQQVPGTWITVSAASLASLKYVGTNAGTETVDLADWSGTTWSYYSTATITTSASASLPTVVVQPESINIGGTIAAASLVVSASDPSGHAIAAYEFKDDGGNGGYFTVNGVKQATGSFFQVSASALSTVNFVATATAGSENVEVAVSNGTNWSYAQSTVITTTVPLAPVVTAQSQTVAANGTLAASSLISVADVPANSDIVTYGFRDDGGGAGYFTVNGVRQATGSLFQVAAANLSSVAYVSGSGSGSETFEVEAYNNQTWSSLSTGTIVTKGTQSAAPPVVTAANQTLSEHSSVAASTLIAGTTDPNGNAITYYTLSDSGLSGAYLSLNGIRQAANAVVTVTASQLANATYTAGNTAGSDVVKIQAYDGSAWSNVALAQVTTTAPVIQLPTLTVQNETVNAGAANQASSLIAGTSDPAGNAITQYDFRDDGGNGGHFVLGGATQATGSWINVSAAQLSQLTYVGGSGAGTETVDIAVYDGQNWSNYQTATITTTANAALPMVTVQNESTAANGTLAASSLITSSTSGIASFNFRDDGGGAGYFSLNGVKQSTGSWITVSAANLSTLTFVAGGTAGTETVDVEVNNGSAWSNYQTATIAVTGTSSANPVIAKLTTPVIQADAARYIVNNSLSYAGMLAILQDVAAQGAVTAGEFNDLKTLVGAFNVSGGVSVTPYVAAISNSLVNGDPANAKWTGGNTTSVALGNLQAGSSQTVLNELIGKWFLGTDMPAPVFAGDLMSQNASQPVYTGTYVADTNPLFNNTGAPSTLDINQGAIGDCYFLSSLIAVAEDEPQAIESAITANGNGTYSVRFYINGKATYVTVNNEIPIDSSGQYNKGNPLGNMANDLWASLMEKAYVQLNQEPGATGNGNHPTGNAYWMIDGGFADPITQITGRSVNVYAAQGTEYPGTQLNQAQWDALKPTVIADIQNKLEVLYASEIQTYGSNGQQNLESGHMFCTVSYDSTTGDFILQNPWGSAAMRGWQQTFATTFEISWDQLWQDQGVIYTANATAGSEAAPGATLAASSSVASAINLFTGGKLSGAITVSDSAANISANFDQLEAMQAAGLLSQLVLIDSGTPNLSLTGAQLNSDEPLLTAIQSTGYTLSVTGAASASAAANLTSSLISDLAAPLSVSDSAINVQSNLDGLQSLAAAGKLGSITLTDGGVPTLTLTASALTRDAGVIAQLSGNYSLNASADQINQTISGIAGHGMTVDFSGTAATYTITPAGDGVAFTISGAGSIDHLSTVTALQFSNVTDIIASQTPAVAGGVSSFQVTSLYAAVFSRLPDIAGLAYYENLAATNPGTSILTYAQNFLSSPEYASNSAHNYLQTSAGDAQFITDTYNNLLHRAPEAGSVAWYQASVINPILSGLTPGTTAYSQAELQAHATVLTNFSQSSEFLADVQVTATTPSSTSHWLVLI